MIRDWSQQGNWRSADQVAPAVVRVARGPIDQTVRARGIVKPAPNALVRIGFPMPKDVSRRIRSLRVVEGDVVTAGMLLGDLDTSDLTATLQQLRGEATVVQKRLDALRALEPRELHLAETVRDQAAAQSELAERNLTRGAQLRAQALLPEQNHEALASDAKVARARLANAEANLSQLRTRFATDITTLEAQLQQADAAIRNAQVQIDWGTLPISARCASRNESHCNSRRMPESASREPLCGCCRSQCCRKTLCTTWLSSMWTKRSVICCEQK
jgi:multidrug efflux pump subunit AcrA (membrane-fusion protein)